jgi:hypothetical protein
VLASPLGEDVEQREVFGEDKPGVNPSARV